MLGQIVEPMIYEHGSKLKLATNILSYAILACGVLTFAVAIYVVVVSYSELPYSDGWRQLDPLVLKTSPTDIGWLWTQVNEHRLLIPKLFLAAGLQLFHARQAFLLVSILAIQFAHLALLGWSMRALGGWTGALWRTGLGLVAFCLFCPSQWENFVWGFQVCFVLPGLFATLSFVGLLLYWIHSQDPIRKERSWPFLLLSIAAALGATYSLANGNLLWPLLIIAAIFLHCRPAVLSITATGAISTALYFYHYTRPEQHASITSSMRSPLQLLKYTAAYFGSTWVRERNRPAELVGLSGLLFCFLVLVYLRPRFPKVRPFSLQLALTLLFCVGTAFITSMGRLNFGIAQAFSSRYQTVALLFWCCLGLTALVYLFGAGNKKVAILLAQVLLLAIVFRGAMLAHRSIQDARLHGFELNAAATAVLTGVYDGDQFYSVGLVRPKYMWVAAQYMQKDRLSIFADDLYSQLGKPLGSLYQLDAPSDCAGVVESAAPVEGDGRRGVRVTGWAWNTRNRQAPSNIVFASSGLITGLGAVGDWRSTSKSMGPNVTNNYIGYTGYVQERHSAAPLEVYAILPNEPKRACLIATVN